MNLPPSKADIREELEQQMRAFLAKGGEVNQVPRGLSGRDSGEGPIRPNSFVPNAANKVAPEDQVPLTNVVQSIEARRRAKPKSRSTKAVTPRPRKRLIYDDFGEPLRWEWVNE